jgi:hypothetical protein
MTRSSLALTLALTLAASSAALAHGGGHGAKPDHRGPHGGDAEAPQRGGKARTQHVAHACVVAPATADGVEVRTLSANRHLRRALKGSTTFTVRIGTGTDIRLVGRARRAADGTRKPKAGTVADLTAGVRVTVRIRAPRGTAAADLPPAARIVVHGAVKRCALPPTPPPGEGTGGGTGGTPQL